MSVASFVPGRIRLKFPGLKANPPRCRSVEQTCLEVDGVLEATASALTGSLLVIYDPGLVERAPFAEELGEALCAEFPDYDAGELMTRIAPPEPSVEPKPSRPPRPKLVDTIKKVAKLTRGEIESEYSLDADENGRIEWEREITAPVGARLREFKVSTVGNCRGRKHRAGFRVTRQDGAGDRLEFGPIEIVDCIEAIGEVDFRVERNVPYTLHMQASGFEPHESVTGLVCARIELD